MKTEDNKKNILDYLPDELETVASELGEKKFKFTVSGVLADGVGIGRASYKNIVVDASL